MGRPSVGAASRPRTKKRMRKLYPFGWIDRDLKELGFLKEMSASAAKLYILYVLAGGAEGKSCYGAEATMGTTGLSKATIYKARQELEDMGLITAQKEMVHGRRNKKPKIWVELQDLPVNRVEIKRRRDKAREEVIVRRVEGRRSGLPAANKTLSAPRIEPPAWIKQASEQLRRKREGHV